MVYRLDAVSSSAVIAHPEAQRMLGEWPEGEDDRRLVVDIALSMLEEVPAACRELPGIWG